MERLRNNIFTFIGVHPFEKIGSKVDKHAMLSPEKKIFPGVILISFTEILLAGGQNGTNSSFFNFAANFLKRVHP